MRSVVRTRANNQRATDAEIDLSINEHIAALWEILVEVRGEQWAKSPTPQTVTTIAGTPSYALGVTILRTLGVWWQVGVNDHREILPYDMNQARGPQRTYGWNQYNGTVYFQLEGANIRFQPVPQSVFTIIVDFIPAAVQLVADTDQFDGYNGWELYPIYMAAADIARDENDFELSDRLEGKGAALEARIRKFAQTRDALNPPRMILRRQAQRAYDEDEDIVGNL